MKRFLLLMTLLIFIWGTSPAVSQNLKEILKNFEEIEKRLDRIEAAHKRDVSKLHQKTYSAAQSGDWASVKKSLSYLSEQVENLQDEIHTSNYDWERLMQIEGELEQLKLRADQWNTGSNEYADLKVPNIFQPRENKVLEEPAAETFGLEITGFGDAIATFEQNNTEGNYYGINQAEVDLEANLNRNVNVAAALAYGDVSFELAVFLVDFHIFGSEGDHIRAVNGIDHSGVIVGQFDVPFGIDYNVYASVDRKLVSAPLTVENTHDGWNDQGIQVYIATPWINAVVYGVNGFGYEWTDVQNNTSELGVKTAFGGRLGITPIGMVEVGGSYAGFVNENDDFDMAMIGADLQFHIENFRLKGEFVAHQTGLSADETVTNTGFYGQCMYDFGKFFLVSRFGMFSPDETGIDDLTRFSAGAGWVIHESCELRFEYQANSGEENNMSFLQMAVGF